MRILYFFSETFTNLRRNLLMTVAAISTVAISLLLLGGVQILGMVVNNMTRSWEARVEVSIFFRDDATDNEIQSLTRDVVAYEQVDEVQYISKQEAFEEYKQMWKDQPEFWQSLPEDSLPASLRVKLHDANDAPAVAANVSGAPGVDEVKYGGELIKTLLKVNSLLRTVTLVMSVILMIAAAALIANAIRIAIYARRDEIGIMKLVGATNWFIRIPYMLEGVIAALVGAAVSGVIVLASNSLLFSRVGEAFPVFRPVFTFSGSELTQVLLVLVGVGTLVGLVGSSMALRRFLEV